MSIEESFKGMTSAFNTDYVHDEEVNEKMINEIEVRKNEIVNKIEKLPSVTLEDKDYMQLELKHLISGGFRILELLEQDIRVGTKPRTHEIYFTGLDKVGNLLKELRELNKTVKQLEIDEIKAGNTHTADLTVTHKLDGRSILKMLKNAQTNNSLNEISADFKVDDK